MGDLPTFKVVWGASKHYEAVYAFAHALHDLIGSRCPEAFVDRSQLKLCVDGAALLQHLRNVSININGFEIEFDKVGDMKPSYIIKQFVMNGEGRVETVAVGRWDKDGGGLFINEALSNFYQNASQAGQWPADSVCSRPCGAQRICRAVRSALLLGLPDLSGQRDHLTDSRRQRMCGVSGLHLAR